MSIKRRHIYRLSITATALWIVLFVSSFFAEFFLTPWCVVFHGRLRFMTPSYLVSRPWFAVRRPQGMYPWDWRWRPVLGMDEKWYFSEVIHDRPPGDGMWWEVQSDVLHFLTIPIIYIILATALVVWCIWPRRPKPGCQQCGYDLTGNVSGVCP